ncbi:sigma-70 family RNA polymerase sigma factor [soil metagenome]
MSSPHVEAARAGDPVALEALLRERRAEVVRYAMRLCVSSADAEDATQEALIALSRYIGALREVAALSRWLFVAVRTHCVRLARRSLKHVLAGEAIELEGPEPEEQFVDRQLRQRLAVVVAAMAPDLREVLLRRDVLGDSAREAADALGISVPALKSRLHRARAAAREALIASLSSNPSAPRSAP